MKAGAMITEREPVGSVSDRELIEKWQMLAFEPATPEIRELVAAFPDRRELCVPFEACGTDYRFTAPLLQDPDRTLRVGRRALREFVDDRFDCGIDPDDRVYLRVTNVPDSVRQPLESIRTEHLNRLVVVGGTVAQVDRRRPRVVTASFECERCGEYTTVPQRNRRLRGCTRCSHCSAADRLALAPNRCSYVDAQELVLEDGGRRLPVALEHDLTDRFEVGDRIDVAAIPRARLGDGSTIADFELEGVSAKRRAAADGGER